MEENTLNILHKVKICKTGDTFEKKIGLYLGGMEFSSLNNTVFRTQWYRQCGLWKQRS